MNVKVIQYIRQEGGIRSNEKVAEGQAEFEDTTHTVLVALIYLLWHFLPAALSNVTRRRGYVWLELSKVRRIYRVGVPLLPPS